MESLAALGFAANVVDFVQFAADLLRSTRSIYSSVKGASENVQGLDEIYTRLSQLSGELNPGVLDPRPQRAALADVAAQCKVECDRLLSTVGKHMVKDRGKQRLWNSFQGALREWWDREEVAGLKERIDSYQKILVLELCSISQ